MATYHWKWQTEMTNVWREGGTPNFSKRQVEEKDWEEFCKYRETEKFDAVSQIGKANQAHNEYPYFLGSEGYNGGDFQSKLKDAMKAIENEKVSIDLSFQGSTTTALTSEEFVDFSVEHRHVT